MKCVICLARSNKDLCERHSKLYVFDPDINGYRLKKRGTGSRYIQGKYHGHEIELTKILEDIYGPKEVITSYRPLWAKSKKGALLEFDIYIPKEGLLVEYNGKQHYFFVEIFHKTIRNFFLQKKRDKLKYKMARDNNMKIMIVRFDEPLVRDHLRQRIHALT